MHNWRSLPRCERKLFLSQNLTHVTHAPTNPRHSRDIAESMKVHCSCITILGFTAQGKKCEKFINIHQYTKTSRRSSIILLEVFCKNFVAISYEYASFCIRKDSMAAACLFLNYKYIFVCEYSFSDQWRHLT